MPGPSKFGEVACRLQGMEHRLCRQFLKHLLGVVTWSCWAAWPSGLSIQHATCSPRSHCLPALAAHRGAIKPHGCCCRPMPTCAARLARATRSLDDAPWPRHPGWPSWPWQALSLASAWPGWRAVSASSHPWTVAAASPCHMLSLRNQAFFLGLRGSRVHHHCHWNVVLLATNREGNDPTQAHGWPACSRKGCN